MSRPNVANVDLYNTPEGVEDYVSMAEGYDGRDSVAVLTEMLAPGSRVLELGMGPGVDLGLLAERFDVVGSDRSQAFLDRYRSSHPDIELLVLDAVTIDIDQRFDAIYSNKVLHHLTTDELALSLVRQTALLEPDGLLLHGMWFGEGTEDHQGMFCQNHTCESFLALSPAALELDRCEPYAEFDKNDSFRIVLRKKKTKD